MWRRRFRGSRPPWTFRLRRFLRFGLVKDELHTSLSCNSKPRFLAVVTTKVGRAIFDFTETRGRALDMTPYFRFGFGGGCFFGLSCVCLGPRTPLGGGRFTGGACPPAPIEARFILLTPFLTVPVARVAEDATCWSVPFKSKIDVRCHPISRSRLPTTSV